MDSSSEQQGRRERKENDNSGREDAGRMSKKQSKKKMKVKDTGQPRKKSGSDLQEASGSQSIEETAGPSKEESCKKNIKEMKEKSGRRSKKESGRQLQEVSESQPTEESAGPSKEKLCKRNMRQQKDKSTRKWQKEPGSHLQEASESQPMEESAGQSKDIHPCTEELGNKKGNKLKVKSGRQSKKKSGSQLVKKPEGMSKNFGGPQSNLEDKSPSFLEVNPASQSIDKSSSRTKIDRGNQWEDITGSLRTVKSAESSKRLGEQVKENSEGQSKPMPWREFKEKLLKEHSARQSAQESESESIEERVTLTEEDLGNQREEASRNSMEEDEEFFDAVERVDPVEHPLWPEIERTTVQMLHQAEMTIDGGNPLFEEGDMRIMLVECGPTIGPIRVTLLLHGATAEEVVACFFRPEHRLGWENTLEEMHLLEKISNEILVFHQVHRRIWPVAPRDSVFWSRLLELPQGQAADTWAVLNQSTSHPGYPPPGYKACSRIHLSVSLLARTILLSTVPGEGPGAAAPSRDRLASRITYTATVDPGGWVPSFACRATIKREYPKFLKKFSEYVTNETKNKPLPIIKN